MTETFRRRRGLLAAAAVTALLAAGCSTGDGGDGGGSGDRSGGSGSGADERAAAVEPPPANAPWDYQIGGGYPPPRGVEVVSRDRSDEPAPGLYGICYVNGFQAQPEELAWWQRDHPDLLLRDADGELVIDENWNEALLDISTAAKRERIAAVVAAWTDGCAEHGFQAVEYDNLDSYTRSDGLLDAKDAVAFAALLVRHANEQGLAAAQKNTSELLGSRARTGFDFAVSESCARYDECTAYLDAYRGRVVDVEYSTADYRKACEQWGDRLSVVQRDLDVRPKDRSGYVYRSC